MHLREFIKATGAGNDFVLAMHDPSIQDYALEAADICSRKFGAGADGLIVIEPTGQDTVVFRGWNSDGSTFSLCTNGFRCAARMLHSIQGFPRSICIQSGSRELTAFVMDQRVRLNLWRPQLQPKISTDYDLVSTGDNHAVFTLTSEQAEGIDFGQWAVQKRRELSQAGLEANIHWLVPDGRRWGIRSFEKGIEAETLSCGSGCLSCAEVLAQGQPNGRFRFMVHGGSEYRVGFLGDRCFISGPAELLFRGMPAGPIN